MKARASISVVRRLVLLGLGFAPVLAACADTSDSEQADATGSSESDGGGDDSVAAERPPTPAGCGDGVLEGAIYLERGPEELARLDGIGTVTGDVVIDKTDAESLAGFECLVEIGGDLQIFGNAQLGNLGGFDNLWRVKGHVVISENPLLTDIDALDGLTYAGRNDTGDFGEKLRIGGLVIKSNPSLQAISGLGSLREITGSLIIQYNEALTSMDGLDGLRLVDGLFAVTHNPALCLSSINAVGEGLTQSPDEGSSTRNNDPGC